MPLTPFPVEEFGGLNLLADPTEVGMSAAVDMLNAETLRVLGRLATRNGMTRLATGLLGNYHKITPADTDHILMARNAGASLGFEFATISAGTTFAAVGAHATYGSASTRLTSTLALQVSGLNAVALASRSGASNESLHVAVSPNVFSMADIALTDTAPRYCAMTPWDVRVVQAHFTSTTVTPTGANGTTSTLFFSDPGASGTYGANNWIKVAPGDGDEITGVATWRELMFVIKRSQMFVFYGTSIASDGSPVFQYRVVSLPSRARVTTNGGGENIIAGSDGVYLLLSDGLYRTTGSTPERVSGAVGPIFDGTGPSSMLFPTSGDWNIGYAANRVYLTYPVGGAFRTLLYDTLTQAWLLWDITAAQSALPTNVTSWIDANGTPATYVASGARIYTLNPTATSDDGTAISWSYQTGYSSAGGYFRQRIVSSGERKRHHHVDILGSGTVTHQVLTLNSRTADIADPGGSVTLGTAPALARGYRRRGARGTHIAHKLSGSGPAVISDLTYWLTNVGSDT